MKKVSEPNRKKISDELGIYLAELYAVYLKTQNFHWNVTGPEFFSLHLLLDKQYKEMAEEIDEIAERIRGLGFFVEASFSSFQKLMTIKEAGKKTKTKEMLRSLIKSHETLLDVARNLSSLADDEHDYGTVDLLGRRMGSHEFMAWMLKSQL